MYVYFMRGWNVCNISLNCFISVMFLPAGGNDMHIFKAGHHAQKKKQIEEKAKVVPAAGGPEFIQYPFRTTYLAPG